ncbi:hypothetical protein V8E53_014031 [Lactarius tabidus]
MEDSAPLLQNPITSLLSGGPGANPIGIHLNNLLQHGMLRGGHTPGRNILLPPNAQAFPPNGNNGDDEGPVDENILGHVILAQSCGMN